MSHAQIPKSLNDLLARAEHYAGFSITQMGRVPPTLMALCHGRLIFYLPEFDSLGGRFAEILPHDSSNKDIQAKARRLLKTMGITDNDLRGDARWS